MFKKEKYLILTIAILCSLYFISSFVLMTYFNNGNYTPLVVSKATGNAYDQTVIAAFIMEAYDGRLIVTDSVIYENKNKFNFLAPIFPALFLGLMSHLTYSIPVTFIISALIFPLLIFLLVFWIIFRETKNIYVSMLCPTFLLIGLDLINRPPITPANIFFHINKFIDPIEPLNYFNRLPFIQFTFILILLSFIMLYMGLEKNGLIYFILCGILTGILFYSYFYYWVSFFGAIFLLFFFYLLKKRFKESKNLLIVIIIAGIISIPFWSGYLNVRFSGNYDDIVSRASLMTGFKDFDYLATIKYVIFLSFFFIIVKNDNFFKVSFAIILSGLLGLNMHLFAGISPQPGHFEAVLLSPFVAMLIFYLLWHISVNEYKSNSIKNVSIFLKMYFKHISIVLIFILLTLGFYSQYAYAKNTHNLFSIEKEYLQSYDWLKNNSEKDSVIVTLNIEQNLLLPVYTHNNVFYPYGIFSLSPTNESLERLYISYKLFGLNQSNIENFIDNAENHAEIRKSYIRIDPVTKSFNEKFFQDAILPEYLFHGKYLGKDDNYHIPDDVKKNIIKEFNIYINETKLLSKYRIDYIMITPIEKSLFYTIDNNYFKKVYDNSVVEIYKKSS